MEKKIPDFAGNWEMKSSENFEELLKALSKYSLCLQPDLFFAVGCLFIRYDNFAHDDTDQMCVCERVSDTG